MVLPIKNTCYIAFADVTQIELSVLLTHPLLPKSLIDYARTLPIARRQQYLACRLLLAEIIHRVYHIKVLPEIILNDNARPVFADQRLPHFNISHSEHVIAVVVASQGHIGLDIEVLRARKHILKIAQHCFSPSEIERLLALEPNKQLNLFWQLWTLRESILKMCSKGVWQMRQITIDLPTSQVTANFCPQLHYRMRKNSGFSWSVCSNTPIDQVDLHFYNQIR